MKPTLDQDFERSASEQQLSDLYQDCRNNQTEKPSVQLDSAILEQARQNLKTPLSLIKTFTKKHSTWRGPFSLVASLGVLAILLVTQRDMFLQQQDIIHDVNQLPTPVSTITEMPIVAEVPAAEVMADNLELKDNLSSLPQLIQQQSAAKKNFSPLQTNLQPVLLSADETPPQMMKEQMLKPGALKQGSVKVQPMTLFEMSKLAEVIKLELATQNRMAINNHQVVGNDDVVIDNTQNMQSTLFEHLMHYQQVYPEFSLTDKFKKVLTDEQIKQLNPGEK
jgi:hypothetical protein